MKEIYVFFNEISHYDMLNLYIDEVFDIILGDENIRLKSPNFSYEGYSVAHGDKLSSEMRCLEQDYSIPKHISCFFVMAYFHASKRRREMYQKHHSIDKTVEEIKEFIDEFPEVVVKINEMHQFMIDNINKDTQKTVAKEWN